VLATNIAVPTISSGRQALHLLPDRVLVRNGRRFSDAPYSALRVSVAPERFIETGPVPRDSQQVGTTWRFVNKSGGPDRRFNNNRQIPVMLYGRVELATTQGLHWIVDVSRLATAELVGQTIEGAPQSLAQTPDQPQLSNSRSQ
jgi:DNA polymerase-3 subunit epsilon